MTRPDPSPVEPAGDMPFERGDFDRACALIRELAGIALTDAKRQMVYSRLLRRVRAGRHASFARYLDVVASGQDADERTAFVNALTTNLTSFFREAYHFPILAQHLRQRSGPIAIWCSAASTGEEPYSLAITALETLGDAASRVHIVATDIDTDVLAKAEAGVYADERVQALGPERLRRFFQRGTGANAGKVRVGPALRDMVRFTRLNLLDRRWPIDENFDAIFCRNVMIYFDKPTQADIIGRMVPLMKPGALFFAGHSENLLHVTSRLTLRGKTVYSLADEARGTQRVAA
jgi:chemotaxis protein methyltransferase CheR